MRELGETSDRRPPSLVETQRNELIRAVQRAVPLCARPFAALGEELGLSESSVIKALAELQEQGILREISAVLEGSALGHDSALVAGAVAEADLERAVAVINAHPTVTHNYLRNHDLNLWFTIAVPPGMGLERTLELLADEAGVKVFQPLRRTHTFKIGVNFDPESLKNRTETMHNDAVAPLEAGEREARLLRALQTPLPICERPFVPLAAEAGAGETELLAFANQHLAGVIRRYVGTLRHRKLGVSENGMVVWRASDEQIERVGRLLASAPEVSHCYAREAIRGFPYKLYSMVHAATKEACHEIARELAGATGLDDYAVLFSEREFKKARLRYFLPELDAWWAARTGS